MKESNRQIFLISMKYTEHTFCHLYEYCYNEHYSTNLSTYIEKQSHANDGKNNEYYVENISYSKETSLFSIAHLLH